MLYYSKRTRQIKFYYREAQYFYEEYLDVGKVVIDAALDGTL